jgi:hypothetical protein
MLAIWFIAAAVPVCAQDWTPKRIVAITYYVPLAQQARIYGDVEVRCSLGADGSVTRAEPISGHGLLKEQGKTERIAKEVSANRAAPREQYRHAQISISPGG